MFWQDRRSLDAQQDTSVLHLGALTLVSTNEAFSVSTHKEFCSCGIIFSIAINIIVFINISGMPDFVNIKHG